MSLAQNFRAEQWLLQAGLLWCVVWQQVWQRAALNREAAGSPPYPGLGHANRLTVLRGGLIALTAGFLFQPQAASVLAWIPALLYSLAAILDRADGFVARRSNQTSLLGSKLDTIFDALGLVVAPLLAVGYGRVHWSFLLISAAYYLFQWGLYWRKQHARPVYDLVPHALRRTLAGFQMGFIAVVLWPLFDFRANAAAPGQMPLTQLAGMAFMVPVLAGFGVDWLVASGRISLQQRAAANFFERLAILSATVFQPALRVAVFVAFVLFIRISGDTIVPGSLPLHAALLICATLVLAGLAARAAALILVVLLSWQYHTGQHFTLYAVIVCSVWVLLLGSGRFSLWQRDDQWVNRYDGA